ncbi:shikimate kinase [Paenibacillus mesophilus]|uniref:AAA family ATPase n=1 Tax=Paenibacillus mesophilus TaxID=2582849 RepID=UPI00110EC646|nr:AAA family ATPase [Paenibacillus mesophilus]TMV46321.1 shikimate kinase [Paenibacillus mesophilus]
MKFILIFGPQAVGKMTVGQELEKITGLKLFHNHMSIEMVAPFFSYGTAPGKRLVKLFRQAIFEEVANSDLDGLIFTYLWSFDRQADWDYVESVCRIFESKGGIVCFVELEAELELRLERNKSPHRLLHKPTKRNIEFSENDLISKMENNRLNSYDGEIKRENYMRINNSTLSPDMVASMIKQRFDL